MTTREPGSRVAADECSVLPTSFGQERLWLLDRLGAGRAYYLTGAFRLEGRLVPDALARAFNALAERHEVLRTTFEFGPGGVLEQVIHSSMSIPMSGVALPAGSDESAAVRMLTGRLTGPFDLAVGPLMRAVLVSLGQPGPGLAGEPAWLIGVSMHHIVSDGWSVGILLAELAVLYRAELSGTPADLPALPIQYGDFAAWQRERAEHADPALLSYWRDTLAGARPVENVSSGEDAGAAAGLIAVDVPPALADAVRALARKEGAAPFMVLFAAYSAVLARWTGLDDIVVGTPVAGRDRPELTKLIGFFVNTLPLRIMVEGRASFRDLIRRAREACLGAYAHQDVPFERIVEVGQVPREPGRIPLIGASLVLQNTPAPDWRLPGIRATTLELPVAERHFPISLYLTERPDGGLTGRLHHSLREWGRDDAALFAAAWQALLAAAAADPDRTVGMLPVRVAGVEPAAQRCEVTEPEPPIAPEAGRAHQLIEAAACAHPAAVALTTGSESMTYSELDELAGQWAGRLRTIGAGPERPVAVCMTRSVDQIVGLVAVLKTGAASLLLDSGHPPASLRRLMADVDPVIVLTEQAVAATGLLDGLRGDRTPALSWHRAGSLMCVIGAAGSADAPAAVVHTSDAIVNQLLWMRRQFPLTLGDTVLQATPLGPGSWEWMWPLAAGARLVLTDRDAGRDDPGYLARLIGAESAAVCHLTPALLRAFLAEPGAGQCAGVLRRVLCTGEELGPELARSFSAVLPGAELHVLYGPAGVTTAAASHRVAHADSARPCVPVGRALPGVRLRVLNASGQPVPPGFPGELCIGGIALGRGYLRRPALTAERFFPDEAAGDGSRLYRTGDRARCRPDGELEVLGRVGQPAGASGAGLEAADDEAELEPPRTVAEQTIARIWCDVLQLPEVGVRDGFYALGGNSLRAVMVFQNAQRAGLLLPLELMLGDHTIAQLAARLGDNPEETLRDVGRLLA